MRLACPNMMPSQATVLYPRSFFCVYRDMDCVHVPSEKPGQDGTGK